MTTLRLTRPLDPEARRVAAEDRVRLACSQLADALVELAAAAPAETRPVELLDVATAAQRLGSISRSTLYTLMASGAVRAVSVGGRRLIPSSEIERIAAGRPPGRMPGGRDAT
ncbi:MAG: helix-turn-helix domain-containing protein [Candidatus Limnocylindrales bacterium]|jgi:excisionase family DNA binding protein